MSTPSLTRFCPVCQNELRDLQSVDIIKVPPALGDIFLCGMCGTPSKFSLTDMTLLLEDDYDGMSAQEKMDLDFAQRAIKRNIQNQ